MPQLFIFLDMIFKSIILKACMFDDGAVLDLITFSKNMNEDY